MKTEDFDDLIKRKLESISPPASQSEIDRIHSRVSGGGKVAPKMPKLYLMGAAASIGAIIIAVLITWNVRQMREREHMAETIEKLQNEVARNKTAEAPGQAVQPGTEAGVSEKESASGIADNEGRSLDQDPVKENSADGTAHSVAAGQNQPGQAVHDPAQNGYADNTANVPDKASGQAAGKNIASNKTKANTGNQIYNSGARARIPKLASNTRNGVNAYNSPIGEKSKTPAGGNINVKRSENRLAQQKGQSSPGGNAVNGTDEKSGTDKGSHGGNPENPLVKNDKNKAPEGNETPIVTPVDNNKSPEKSKDSQAIVMETDSAAKTAPTNTPDRPVGGKRKDKSRPSGGRPVQLMAGAGLEFARARFGLGLNAQLHIKNGFSFGAGFKVQKYRDILYKDSRDYKRSVGGPANNNYMPQHAMPPDSARNISSSFSIIQLPVFVSYNLPLKNNFGLIFTAGTDIDLIANQDIHFDAPGPGGPGNGPRNNIEENHKAVYFNNVVIAAGVQKQWGHFVGQATPFISPQLATTSYRKQELTFGIRLGAMYAFSL